MTTDELTKMLWDYSRMHHILRKADAIFVLCSRDIRSAEYAAELYRQGLAPYIIFSGGLGKITSGEFIDSEAEMFARIAEARGVPKDAILIEKDSRSTVENVKFTSKLLDERGLNPRVLIVVQKPYTERRAYATCMKLMPDKEFILASFPVSYDEYPTTEIPKDLVVNLLTGDLQRTRVYPEKGYQITQEIPVDVWKAYEELVRRGYTKFLLK